MRRLLLVPALALAVTAALTASAGAGDQEHRQALARRQPVAARQPLGARQLIGGGVSVVVPAGWHLTHGMGTPLLDPVPRLSAATFPVHFSRHYCVCGTPHVARFPRDGAYLYVMEYPALGHAELKQFPSHTSRFRIGASAITRDDCGPSDERLFREGGRGYQVQIYLGPAAPAAVRAQIDTILNSWQVT
ncbi:MAG: hypothetical protein WAU75_00595 [Solirubrobacteraceae bacterium]